LYLSAVLSDDRRRSHATPFPARIGDRHPLPPPDHSRVYSTGPRKKKKGLRLSPQTFMYCLIILLR